MDNGAYEKYKAETASNAATLSRPNVDKTESAPLSSSDLGVLVFFLGLAVYALWQIVAKARRSSHKGRSLP